VSRTFSSRIGGYGVVAGANDREDATEALSSLAQQVCFLARKQRPARITRMETASRSALNSWHSCDWWLKDSLIAGTSY
jgi:hypothetical protein